jgi:lysophospholipase L1-like esterase
MTPVPAFARYVALGDSMSIDLYPGLDHQSRTGGTRAEPGLGAPSLLLRNRDDLYADFAGRDLLTAFPGIQALNLCEDGATVGTVRSGQLPHVPADDAPTLVTVTAGGNDLLELIGVPARRGGTAVAEALRLLAETVGTVRRRLPRSVVLLTTVYDPTDGTGHLERVPVTVQEYGWLAAYNDGVRDLCDGRGMHLVDAHARFLGHGASAPPDQRWYWPASIIEPGLRAASELRRLWLETIAL